MATFPSPSLCYKFDPTDSNLNNQLAEVSSGYPIFNTNMNTSYISKTNYKTNVGALEFPKNALTPATTVSPLTSGLTNPIGIAVSGDQLKILVATYIDGRIYYSSRSSTANAFPAYLQVPNSNANISYSRVGLTLDGTRGVACMGFGTTNYVYTFDWTASAAATPPANAPNLNWRATLDPTQRDYTGLAITPDGSRMVACTSTTVFFTTWNGTNYNTFTPTLQTSGRFVGIGISTNGDRIVYGNASNRSWYISFWNGTNYDNGVIFQTTPYSIGSEFPRTAYFTEDSSVLFLSYHNNPIVSLSYGLYNPGLNIYNSFVNISTSTIPANTNLHGLCYILGNLYMAYLTESNNLNVLSFTQANITTNYCNFNTSNFTTRNTDITISGTPTVTYPIAISVSDNQLKMVLCCFGGYVYYATRTSISSTWSAFTQVSGSPALQYYRIAISPNGTSVVVVAYSSSGASTALAYQFYWTGATPAEWTQTLDTTPRPYCGLSMTSDGLRIVACSQTGTNGGGIYFATFNTSGFYSAFTQISGNPVNAYIGIAVSKNGDRIVYGNLTDFKWYIAYWNGSTYSAGTLLRASPGGHPRQAQFNGDSSILFLSYQANSSFSVEYGYINGSKTYDLFTPVPTSIVPANLDIHGLYYVDNNKSGVLYAMGYDTTDPYQGPIYSAPFTDMYNNFGAVNKIVVSGTTGINIGVSVSQNELKMVSIGLGGGIYYSSRTDKSKDFITFTQVPGSPLTTNYRVLELSSDGTRCVTGVNTGLIYTFDWTGSTPTNWTATLDTTPRPYTGVSITGDKLKMVACERIAMYYATWNGTNYTTFAQIITGTEIRGVGISFDGSKIAYANATNWYLSFWNGTTFPTGTIFYSGTTNGLVAHFSEDESMLFLTSDAIRSVEYGYYNSTLNTYDSFVPITPSLIPPGYNNTNNLFSICYKNNNLYIASTPNIYVATLFPEYPRPFITGKNGYTFATWFKSNYNSNYARIFDFGNTINGILDNIMAYIFNNTLVVFISGLNPGDFSNQQNLLSTNINNNIWYHFAFTLTYSTTSLSNLIVYLNGSQVASANNYHYPRNILRKQNSIGKSNIAADPPYYGAIDDFRMYNTVLTPAQILQIYNMDPTINSFLNINNSTIYVILPTSVDISNNINAWNAKTNMGTTKTYYYWNDPYAASNAYANFSNPIKFSYTYDNTATNFTSVKVYIAIDDICRFQLNNITISDLTYNGSTAAISAITASNMISGTNTFDFYCINGGGPAMFAAFVTDMADNYLFSTTNTKIGWSSQNTGYFTNNVPLYSLIRNSNIQTNRPITQNNSYTAITQPITNHGGLLMISPYSSGYSTTTGNLFNTFYTTNAYYTVGSGLTQTATNSTPQYPSSANCQLVYITAGTGQFTVNSINIIAFVLVGGGGGGNVINGSLNPGAGGNVNVYTNPPSGIYTFTVGAGGAVGVAGSSTTITGPASYTAIGGATTISTTPGVGIDLSFNNLVYGGDGGDRSAGYLGGGGGGGGNGAASNNTGSTNGYRGGGISATLLGGAGGTTTGDDGNPGENSFYGGGGGGGGKYSFPLGFSGGAGGSGILNTGSGDGIAGAPGTSDRGGGGAGGNGGKNTGGGGGAADSFGASGGAGGSGIIIVVLPLPL